MEMLEKKIERAVSDYGMQSIYDGAIIGFSGGADSSSLLHFLSSRTKKLLAVHINHMIRGTEAYRDELFCRSVCEKYGIDFISYKIDIPAIAAREKKGLEETAREERYRIFDEEIKKNPQYRCIVTAHNANDNAETLIFNLARGSGTNGMCGIKPVNGNIMRPLIYCTKKEITSYCDDNNIEYVTDSTNEDIDYTRNRIRHIIIPEMEKINPGFIGAASRLSGIIMKDDEYINSVCRRIISENGITDRADKKLLLSLDMPVFYRVIKHMMGCETDSKTCMLCRSFIENSNVGDFINLGGGISLKAERGYFVFVGNDELKRKEYSVLLTCGVNKIDKIGLTLVLGENADAYPGEPACEVSLNKDRIAGNLYARNRRDGDKIVNGKMTKKLKRVFCDLHIPSHLRDEIPVICDDLGIVCVPGIINRDGVAGRFGEIKIRIYKMSIGGSKND